MISQARFSALQELFFKKVTQCCNPSTVTLKFIKVISTGKYTDFTGDSQREVEKEIVLKCFYMRNISDKQREKAGVNESVTDILYISPIELKNKYGSSTFPNYVRKSYSQMSVEFLGEHYEIDSIRDLEPMHNGKEYVCLAYQINLKATTGNRDFN